jgi:uncharacterized cupredoxin-like copper-binding protein
LFALRSRRTAAVAAGTLALAVAGPALAATTVNEKLSEFRITGASSATAGSITFRVTNSGEDVHELVVIKTSTKASRLKLTADGAASEKGRVKKVTVGSGRTRNLKVTLSKGHYALICNIADHYSQGMRKDFTVR